MSLPAPAELLDRLRALDVRLWVEDDRLRFRAPQGVLTEDLKEAVRAHKEAILAFLREARELQEGSLPPIRPAARAGDLPLSFSQERLWFLEQWRPPGAGAAAYNIADVLRLRGGLDVPALERCLREIVRRHAVLRTRFESRDGRPFQVVEPEVDLSLAQIDLSALPPEARDGCGRALLAELAVLPFDLARGPLLRAALLVLGPEEHLLLFGIHHIVSDGWSSGVLVRELAQLYAGSPLPPLPVQYGDFAVWQRRWLESPGFEAQLAYWKARLAGAEGVLDLPADRPRPPAQTFRGDTLHFALDLPPAQGGTTRFMALLAAFAVWFHRVSGSDDVLVGTPVASRRRPELEPLIGFFVNTLAMRVRMAGDPAGAALLDRVRESVLEDFARQDMPFERLVEELRPERDPSRTPLFQVLFVLQNAPMPELRLPGLALEPVVLPNPTAKFDLTLTVVDGPAPLAASLEHSTDLFDPATARRLAVQLARIAGSLLAHPERRLSELDLLSPAELAQVLREWNDTNAAMGPELVPDLIAAQVERTPDAVALAFEEEALTYRELRERAAGLAWRLRDLGVGADSRVGICAERSLEMVVGLLGILWAGAAYVPVDPDYPADRVAFLLQDSDIPLLLTQRRLLDRLPDHEARVLLLDELPEPVALLPEPAAQPESLAYVIYTSGSTGRPKGAGNSHRAISNRLIWMQDAFGLTPGDRVLQKTPFSFDVSVWEFFWPLMVGARLVIARPGGHQDPAYLADLIAREGITTLHFVPSMLRAFLDAPGLERCACVRRVICSGEAMPADLADRFFARVSGELHNLYGPTEAAVDVTWWACEAAGRGAPVPIGRPVANTTVHVLDRNLRPVPPGVPGELHIGGLQPARGYHGRPELTAEKFIPDPYSDAGSRLYKTGDLTRWRTDGAVEYLGRIDHQVKIRGLRIELGEIEAALHRAHGVREAVVLVREPRPGDQRLLAFVVPDEGETLQPQDLRAHLRKDLPEYMVPSGFVFLEAMPLSPNGKADRKALARQAWTPEPGAGGQAPRNPTEELLASIWSQVLGRQPGIHDNFFEMGGHSLLAVQIVARVEQALGTAVPLRQLFEAPTVAALAERVDRALAAGGAAAPPPLLPVPHDGPLPLSFAQERLWLFEQAVPGTAVYNTSRAGKIAGRLDLPAVRATLDEVVRRHEVLRTGYHMGSDGRPVQVVEPFRPLALPLVDLRGLPAGRREEEALRLGNLESATPMRLDRPPLVRAAVLRLDEEEHAVLLSIHHIAFDLASGGVLLQEIEALYTAFAGRRPSPLPELPLQYADFAVWQRRWLAGEALDRQLDYWRRQLAGVAERPMDLPADRPRPARQSHRGADLRFVVPRRLANGVRRLGQEARATGFMTHLALFQALLFRGAPQDDLVVGTAVSNRSGPELEGLLGFFDNLLPLRTATSDAGGLGFRAFLERVREVALGAYSHQHLPFELLVQELRLERERGRTPLLQAIFLFQLNYPAMTRELAGLVMRPYRLRVEAARFDLSFSLREGPDVDGLLGQIEYDTDLFDAATIRRLAERYLALGRAALADPDLPLADLDLLTPAERHQLLAEWSDTGAPAEPGAIPERVAARALERPHAVAAAMGEEALTYGRLEDQARRLASRLRRAGVGPEARVGVLLERSPRLLVALYGIWKAGGAYLPIDPAYPRARIDFMLADAGARLLLTEELLADLEREEPAAPEAVLEEQLAYVIYTSGSTGQPKGVQISHGSLRRLVDWHLGAFQVTASDVGTHLAGLGFDASVWEVWPYLAAGARLELADEAVRTDPEALRDWLVARGATVSFAPTPLAEALMALPWPEGARLRRLLTGGDRLRRPPRPGLPFELINNYGPTESTVVATSVAVAAGEPSRPPSIGRPIEHLRARVVDPWLQPVPAGIPGELVLGGENLARGYLGRPDLTAERFVPHPWSELPGARLYRTGDRVRWLAGGTLDFLGRVDDQIKVRGFRIEPGEIEAALLARPGVEACAVVAPEAADGSRRLVAFVAGHCHPHTLRAGLADRLPEHMLPALFVSLPELPLTAHGKVDRAALERSVPEPEEEPVAPRTPVEEVLAELFADLLGRTRVGVRDDFFALGGHSLLATRLVSRLRTALEVEVPLEAVFDRPTVAGLAERIEEALAGPRQVPAPFRPVPRDGDLPLSFAQERMWFLDRLQPGDPAYAIPAAVRLRGHLDLPALHGSLRALIARHESLRTTFGESDGRPVQRIAPAAEAAPGFAVADLGGLPADAREAALARALADAEALPFDLGRGPLLRTLLVRLGESEHALIWVLHHIVADGWSLGVFVRELGELYGAAREGRPAVLSPLPIQYADHAAGQRRWLEGPEAGAELAYWRDRLVDAPWLDLPADGPPTASSRGGRHARSLPPDLADAVRALARSQGATLFMTLLAAFSVLLHRLSGQDDLLVGTPIAGRRRAESEGLIGVFLNTLVIRVGLDGRPTFREVLARVRRAALEAYARQEIPFEKLLDELRPGRDVARTPLFQVFFNMLTFPAPPARLGDLELAPLASAEAPAKFDLTLYAAEAGDDLELDWVYKADRFRAGRIAVMAEQLASILLQATADPDLPVDRLSLRTPWAALPDPALPLPRAWSGSIGGRLAAAASRQPEAVALVDAHGAWTYGHLDERAGQLARALAVKGVRPGNVVAVWADRAAALPLALWGVLRAGAAFTILDPAYPAHRLSRQLALAGPRAWIALASAGAPPAELAEGLAWLPGIELPPGSHDPAPELDGLAPLPTVEVGPDDLAYVAFTSGSTGQPRAIEGPQAPLVHFVDWHASAFGLGPADRFSLLSGLAHDPLLRDVFTPLAVGAALHVPAEPVLRDPAELRAWLAEAGVTVAHLTPPLARLLADGGSDGCLPALRRAYLAGETLRGRDAAELRRLTPEVEVVNFYGATETPQGIAWQRVDPACPPEAPVPVGRGIEGVQLLLLNPSGELAGLGELGEICVRSSYLARAYRNDPAATADRFRPADPRIYHTGDLGRYELDGSVVYVGRRDGQIKIRGYRVEPGEVEAALLRHPAVAQAVVVPFPADGEDIRLAAYVVPVDSPVPIEDLRFFLAGELPGYMVPAAWTMLPALPLTPNGKVDRRALPAPAVAGGSMAVAAPRDALELALVRIWEELLEVRPVGIRDDFFALGGHSLLAVRLMSRIRRRFGRDLPLASLFQGATVERLARLLRQRRPAEDDEILVPIQDGAGRGRPPLFVVHPIGGGVLCYAELASRLGPEQPVLGMQSPRSSAPASLEAMARRYLDAMRSEQPAGPYRLAGWSMGGVVAYEMALQLRESGEEVAFLGLVDAAPPQESRDLDEPSARLSFAADLAALGGIQPPPGLDLSGEDFLERLLEAGAEVLPPDMDAADFRRLYEIFVVNARALRAYRPRPCAGRLTLFRAADGPSRPDDLGWRELSGELIVEPLPGDHYTVLRGEGARALAAALRRALAAA